MRFIYLYTMEKSEYNDIPVYFCKSCLSLRILNDTGLEGLDYCDSCGSTSVDSTDIDTWTRLHEIRYGFNYLTGKPNYFKN